MSVREQTRSLRISLKIAFFCVFQVRRQLPHVVLGRPNHVVLDDFSSHVFRHLFIRRPGLAAQRRVLLMRDDFPNKYFADGWDYKFVLSSDGNTGFGYRAVYPIVANFHVATRSVIRAHPAKAGQPAIGFEAAKFGDLKYEGLESKETLSLRFAVEMRTVHY